MSHEPIEPFGPVYPFPVVHYSLEFACAVHDLFQRIRPDAVAVELPHSLQKIVQNGVGRLPEPPVPDPPAAVSSAVRIPAQFVAVEERDCLGVAHVVVLESIQCLRRLLVKGLLLHTRHRRP